MDFFRSLGEDILHVEEKVIKTVEPTVSSVFNQVIDQSSFLKSSFQSYDHVKQTMTNLAVEYTNDINDLAGLRVKEKKKFQHPEFIN